MSGVEDLLRGNSEHLEAKPYYKTALGSAYLGNTIDLIKMIPDNSVSLIATSPLMV